MGDRNECRDLDDMEVQTNERKRLRNQTGSFLAKTLRNADEEDQMTIQTELQKIRDRNAHAPPEAVIFARKTVNDNLRLLACVERLVEGFELMLNDGVWRKPTIDQHVGEVLSYASAILTGESEKGDGGCL